VRGQSGGGGAEAVAGVEGVGAPVSGGVGLRLERRRGRWLRRSIGAERGKSWRGGENSAGGGVSILKGSSGEGAEGWALRGGRAREREGERGRLGCGGESAAERRRAVALRAR
jgi:hypothetical protein